MSHNHASHFHTLILNAFKVTQSGHMLALESKWSCSTKALLKAANKNKSRCARASSNNSYEKVCITIRNCNPHKLPAYGR